MARAQEHPPLAGARWGMPSPLYALKGKKSDPGLTDVRNVGSLIGDDGSASRTGASSRSRALPRTSICPTAVARRYGLHSTNAPACIFRRI
jgi:hypothetical protein